MESATSQKQDPTPKIKKQHSEVAKDDQAKDFFNDIEKEDSKVDGSSKVAATTDPSKLKKQSSYTYWV